MIVTGLVVTNSGRRASHRVTTAHRPLLARDASRIPTVMCTSGGSNTLLHMLGPIPLSIAVEVADLGCSPYAVHLPTRTIWLHHQMAAQRRLHYLALAAAALADLAHPAPPPTSRHLAAVPDS